MTGRVYLVGAGCGEYDLVTLRGMTLLKNCNTVVYDALIDERLLDFVPPEAEKLCVGKRAGKPSESQENINDILIRKAVEGKTVVRLKGGDPFVFGRGGEEMLALKEHGIPCCCVPGISSCIAAPELSGIPVTHRRLSRSFHVITAHTADDVPDYSKYANLDGTLVFLMGLNCLENIAEGLISGGMGRETPAAVISKGGFPSQSTVIGTLGDIAEKACVARSVPPAVIIVGQTVGLELSQQEYLPLRGISVTVTGTKRFSDKLASGLSLLGAHTELSGELRVLEYDKNEKLDNALGQLEKYSWLTLTSMNGADIFLRRMKTLHNDIRKASHLKIAVIGKGTADFLERYGIFADLIPGHFTSAELGKALAENVGDGERTLILRAEKGSKELTDILSENGIAFDDVKTYDVKGEPVNGEISTDYITFASASGAENFFAGGGKISEHTKVICIGGITSGTVKKYYKKEYMISAVSSADGIIKTILEDLK